MRTAATVRGAGPLVLVVDESGQITSVAGRRHPERPYLTCVDLGVARVNGADGPWLDREVGIDDDEIDVTVRRESTRHRATLSVNLRHSLSTGWATRLLIVNTGAEPLTVDRLPLWLRPAPEHRISALAAGSRICWAMQADDGQGPLLTARLTAGAVASIGSDHLELSGLQLMPGQRYVTQLRWELLATPRSVVAGPGRDVLVARTVYELDEPVLLPDDPDAALVVPSDVAVDSVEEADFTGREISAASAGRHQVELRSAEGDVRLELSWVPSLAHQLQIWAESVLGRPRTPAGVVSLEDLPSAIVLQAALGAGGLADADDAADALDLLAARLLDETHPDRQVDSFAVLYLLGEHSRTGDLDLLDAALARAETLLATAAPGVPGLGLAILRIVLAAASVDLGTSAGTRVSRVVGQAVQLAASQVGVAGEEQAQRVGDLQLTAELELLLAVQPLLPPDPGNHRWLSARVRALGAALGGGLPGRLLSPPSVSEHAYLVAVLRMLPEDGYPEITRSWGAPPTLLAQRTILEVLDRLMVRAGPTAEIGDVGDPGGIGTAAAWLALVQRHA